MRYLLLTLMVVMAMVPATGAGPKVAGDLNLAGWDLVSTGSLQFNGLDVWHAGNDGAGGGLDADLLDGHGSDDFATTATDALKLPLAGGTMTGAPVFASGSSAGASFQVSASRWIRAFGSYFSGNIPIVFWRSQQADTPTWTYLVPNGDVAGGGQMNETDREVGGFTAFKLFADDYPNTGLNYRIGGMHAASSYLVYNAKNQASQGSYLYKMLFTLDDVFPIAEMNGTQFVWNSRSGSGNTEVFAIRSIGSSDDVSYGQLGTMRHRSVVVQADGDIYTSGTYNGSGSGLTSLNGSSVASGTVNAARLPSVPIMPADDVQLYVRMRGNDAAGLANVITGTNATSVNGTPAAASVITDGNSRSSVGKCLTFDGSDDWISYGDNFDQTTNDFSVAFWFKCTLSATAQFIDKRSGLYTGYALAIGSSGALRMEMGTGSGTSDTSIGSGYDDGTWHHAVFSFDRDANLLSYVDGALVDTTNISGASAQDLSNTYPFYVGRSRDNLATYPGQMDELLVFTRALTADEARRLYLHGTIQPD